MNGSADFACLKSHEKHEEYFTHKKTVSRPLANYALPPLFLILIYRSVEGSAPVRKKKKLKKPFHIAPGVAKPV